MRKLILLFAIMGIVTSFQRPWDRCAENEIRDNCLNRNGPCYDSIGTILTGPPTPKCCVPGCKCKDGYVKSEEYSKCVSRS